MRAFYDLRPDVPLSAAECAALQHDGQIDRERQLVERAVRRGDEKRIARALSALHRREEAAER